MLLARYEVVTGWRRIDNYIPAIRKVTPKDIMRVAKRYLAPENRTVGILLPSPTEVKKRVEPIR